jgi:4-amino-4-deoxy-L-arabinose transferase-like glycosyltransferase
MENLAVILIFFVLVGICVVYFSRRPRYQALAPDEAPDHSRQGALRLSARARDFLVRLFVFGYLLRFFVAALLSLTDTITSLRLSPDSERYHREGELIAMEMAGGDFNWPNWIDNGWFQFTGLVYSVFGAHPFLIQAINVFLGALTPIIVYLIVWHVYRVERPARLTAILVAFFPSFVYWSCLMLKDPIAILAISSIVLSVLGFRQSHRLHWLVLMAASLAVVLSIRSYLFFVIVFMIAMSYFPVDGRRTGTALLRMAAVTLVLGFSLYFAGYGFLGLDYITQSHYFDLDYINSTRVAISHGGGAFFDEEQTPLWGDSLMSTLHAAATAIFYFFVTLDLSDVGGARQLMALPEVLLILILLPSFVRGLRYSWIHHRQAALPLIVFAFGLLAVYGSATTNMGAMYRWRMQAMPFLVTFMVVGVLVKGRGLLYRVLKRIRL